MSFYTRREPDMSSCLQALQPTATPRAKAKRLIQKKKRLRARQRRLQHKKDAHSVLPINSPLCAHKTQRRILPANRGHKSAATCLRNTQVTATATPIPLRRSTRGTRKWGTTLNNPERTPMLLQCITLRQKRRAELSINQTPQQTIIPHRSFDYSRREIISEQRQISATRRRKRTAHTPVE